MSDFQFTPANGNPFAHLGAAAGTAYSTLAPLDEVAQAGQEVVSTYGEAPSADLMTMMTSWIKLQQAEAVAGRMVQKALQMTTPGNEDPKARTSPVLNHMGGPGGRYIPKQGVPFSVLKGLSKRIEVIQAIHRTRNRQVAAFANLSTSNDTTGWRLRARDPNAILDDDHHAYLAWLSQFLECGGREFDPLARQRNKREAFGTFLKKLIDDSLCLDHVAVETVPLIHARGLDAFFVRDSATFMFSTAHFSDGLAALEADADSFLIQEVQPGMMDSFNHAEMSLFQRNPQTDLEWCGYGLSEEESSIETISNFLQAMAFTREGIDNNAIPRGILMVSGNYDPTQMQAFQAMWQAKVRGAQNAFGLPMLSSRGQTGAAQFIQTGQPFSEMAFSKWISLQTALACSIYGLDPTEINIAPFADSRSALSGDDTGERLAAAKDKGLRPLLSDVESFVGDAILSRFAPWARLEFTGLNPGDQKFKETERARLSTINEARETLGMKPHPVDSIGALPADPGILSAEFQRYQAILTLDEGRKCWGGLDPYPEPKVGIMPLNPAMQAVVSQAMQPEQEGPPGEEGDEQGDGPPGEEEGSGEAPGGFGGEVSDRLSSLKGGGGE